MSIAGLPRKKTSSAAWLLLLLVALIIVGVSRLLFHPNKDVPRVRVVAAAMDIPAGTRLGYSNLRYMDLPKPYWTGDMVPSTNLLAGRCAAQYLSRGEPVLSSQALNGKDGMSSLLSGDERAITLKLTEASLVGRAIEPGDLVDVLCTTSRHAEKITRTICQGARVIMAAPQEAISPQKAQASYSPITLAVSPGNCERISNAEDSGIIKLVLRNHSDVSRQAMPGCAEDQLFACKSANLPPVAASAELLPPPALAPGEKAAEQPDDAWRVEMYSGSRKDICSVPRSTN